MLKVDEFSAVRVVEIISYNSSEGLKMLASRFKGVGFDCMSDRDILAFLLSFCCNKDTFDGAGCLLNNCGDIHRLFDMTFDQLTEYGDITKNAAVFIKLTGACCELARPDKVNIFDYDALTEYLTISFLGHMNEEIFISELDENNCITELISISEGNSDKVTGDGYKLLSGVIDSPTKRILVIHNHPFGSCLPSSQDTHSTFMMGYTLEHADLHIAEHISVGKDGIFLILRGRFCPRQGHILTDKDIGRIMGM